MNWIAYHCAHGLPKQHKQFHRRPQDQYRLNTLLIFDPYRSLDIKAREFVSHGHWTPPLEPLHLCSHMGRCPLGDSLMQVVVIS